MIFFNPDIFGDLTGDNDFDSVRSREFSCERFRSVCGSRGSGTGKLGIFFVGSRQVCHVVYRFRCRCRRGRGQWNIPAVMTGKFRLGIAVLLDFVARLFCRDCEWAVDCCPCSTFLSILEISSSESCTGFLDTFENMAKASTVRLDSCTKLCSVSVHEPFPFTVSQIMFVRIVATTRRLI